LPTGVFARFVFAQVISGIASHLGKSRVEEKK
jgi:hypothetical protein